MTKKHQASKLQHPKKLQTQSQVSTPHEKVKITKRTHFKNINIA